MGDHPRRMNNWITRLRPALHETERKLLISLLCMYSFHISIREHKISVRAGKGAIPTEQHLALFVARGNMIYTYPAPVAIQCLQTVLGRASQSSMGKNKRRKFLEAQGFAWEGLFFVSRSNEFRW